MNEDKPYMEVQHIFPIKDFSSNLIVGKIFNHTSFISNSKWALFQNGRKIQEILVINENIPLVKKSDMQNDSEKPRVLETSCEINIKTLDTKNNQVILIKLEK